jgi:hypothetical protein
MVLFKRCFSQFDTIENFKDLFRNQLNLIINSHVYFKEQQIIPEISNITELSVNRTSDDAIKFLEKIQDFQKMLI